MQTNYTESQKTDLIKIETELQSINDPFLFKAIAAFPKAIECTIDTSNNPNGRFELAIAANGNMLGEFYYDSKEDAENDMYALVDMGFEVTNN